MTALLGTSIVSITLALVFYSIGTWAERLQRVLKRWHIVFFVLGLCMDTLGTAIMSRIASEPAAMSGDIGADGQFLHALTGLLAIILMAIHAIWAIWTYWKGSPKAKENFSKFSVVVWAFWLIPYVLGIFLGMSH